MNVRWRGHDGHLPVPGALPWIASQMSGRPCRERNQRNRGDAYAEDQRQVKATSLMPEHMSW